MTCRYWHSNELIHTWSCTEINLIILNLTQRYFLRVVLCLSCTKFVFIIKERSLREKKKTTTKVVVIILYCYHTNVKENGWKKLYENNRYCVLKQQQQQQHPLPPPPLKFDNNSARRTRKSDGLLLDVAVGHWESQNLRYCMNILFFFFFSRTIRPNKMVFIKACLFYILYFFANSRKP